MRFTFTPTLEDSREVRRLITRARPWSLLGVIMVVVGCVSIAWLGYYRWTHSAYPLLAVVTFVGPYVVLGVAGAALIGGGVRERHLWILVAIATALLVLLAKLAFPFDPPAELWRDMNPLGYIVALWWAWAIGAPIMSARAFRKHPLCGVEANIELTPAEVRFSTSDATTAVRWRAFAGVVETPGYFLFFYSKTSAGYLPTRVVPPGDLAALRAFLQPHLGVIADAHGALSAD